MRVARRSSAVRCAWCHEAGDGLLGCHGCGTRFHVECRPLDGRCPTLGCASSPFDDARADHLAIEGRARAWWRAHRGAAAFVVGCWLATFGAWSGVSRRPAPAVTPPTAAPEAPRPAAPAPARPPSATGWWGQWDGSVLTGRPAPAPLPGRLELATAAGRAQAFDLLADGTSLLVLERVDLPGRRSFLELPGRVIAIEEVARPFLGRLARVRCAGGIDAYLALGRTGAPMILRVEVDGVERPELRPFTGRETITDAWLVADLDAADPLVRLQALLDLEVRAGSLGRPRQVRVAARSLVSSLEPWTAATARRLVDRLLGGAP